MAYRRRPPADEGAKALLAGQAITHRKLIREAEDNFYAIILRCLEVMPQREVAQRLEVAASTVGAWQKEGLKRAALAAGDQGIGVHPRR